MEHLVEFFGIQKLATEKMLGAIKDGALPEWLAPYLRVETNSWMVDRGRSELESSYLVAPGGGFSALICSDEQITELRAWLDSMSPGWPALLDGYGNPCVASSPRRANPLEAIMSPEARGDHA